MWKKVALVVFIMASPTLAYAMPQTQDEWFVDSGRYINGHVPSYEQGRTQTLYLTAYAPRRHQRRTVERRTSAFVPQGYFASSREQMVMTLGN
jgi:hypothetical protein